MGRLRQAPLPEREIVARQPAVRIDDPDSDRRRPQSVSIDSYPSSMPGSLGGFPPEPLQAGFSFREMIPMCIIFVNDKRKFIVIGQKNGRLGARAAGGRILAHKCTIRINRTDAENPRPPRVTRSCLPPRTGATGGRLRASPRGRGAASRGRPRTRRPVRPRASATFALRQDTAG